MSEKLLIFFSYSRDNSDFVLNLAKELKGAGANAWLDQLDIKPGTRWDKSIENALDASKTVLVVLSKSSVDSNNVMDEVSYALEEGKTVIPVLMEECDVPFRLRRLQFADFTQSHDNGLETLMKALGLESKVPAQLAEEPDEGPQKIESPQVDEEPTLTNGDFADEPVEPDDDEDAIPHQSKTKNRLPLYIGGGVIALLIVLFASGVFSRKPKPVNAKESKVEAVEVDKAERGAVETENARPDYEAINLELKKLAKEIKFESGRPDLMESGSEKSDPALNKLHDIMKRYSGSKINIIYYYSRTEGVLASRLADKRASIVKSFLTNKGIAAERITASSSSSSKYQGLVIKIQK